MKGLGDLMKQAQQVQERMQEMQEELARMEVTGESGAGMVKVVMNGRHEVRKVLLDDSLLEEEKTLIEDLVQWENTNNEAVLDKARAEIRKAWRETCELNKDHPQAAELFFSSGGGGGRNGPAGRNALPLSARPALSRSTRCASMPSGIVSCNGTTPVRAYFHLSSRWPKT